MCNKVKKKERERESKSPHRRWSMQASSEMPLSSRGAVIFLSQAG